MRHIPSLTILIPLLAASCIYEFPVTDNSFEFAAQVVFDMEQNAHRLTLTKVSGCSQEEYTIAFSIDGEAQAGLTGKDGRVYDSPFTESFSQVFVRTYTLPQLPLGGHVLRLTVSTGYHRQELEVPFEVTSVPFSIHSEVSTLSAEGTALLLSLTDGDAAASYQVTVAVDGMAVDGMGPLEADFSSTPIMTLFLPLQRPGRHEVSVTVTDGLTTDSSVLPYTEPVRHPWLDIALRHDGQSGWHVAEVGDNPYGIALSLDTSLSITGRSTFCISTYEYYYTDITYSSKVKTMSDSHSSHDVHDVETVPLIDRDALAARMTASYETSNRMERFYDPGVGGEDSGREWWEKTGTERAYYSITREDLSVGISAEHVEGVTLRVTNRIGKMLLNGEQTASGETHMTL